MEKEIKLDALKLIAESYGFELVEKKREIKVGDFGKFWDKNSFGVIQYGYLKAINSRYYRENGNAWQNFRHLTDEEKQAITEKW